MQAAKVLMVGAGGIGCELLKTLALSGFSDIHIVSLRSVFTSRLHLGLLPRFWISQALWCVVGFSGIYDRDSVDLELRSGPVLFNPRAGNLLI
jgi:hypothetical protein